MNHWEVLKTQDTELNDKIQAWRAHINDKNDLDRKYKELLMVSMSCVRLFRDGVLSHGQFALDYGATPTELFAAVEQAIFIGGIPAFKTGAECFFEICPDAVIGEKK
ncbi:MAG: carboxymuconolactone decarboxylase family protein [Clostridiales bacterium]|nr:carboxymuconolactone decarboxylase family protein [Clostridiales bacterium]